MQLAWGAVLVLLGMAVWTDLRTRRIPNWLTVSGMCIGLLLQLLLGGLAGGFEALKGLALGFALLLILFLRGGMGGGDVKLLMAIGACTGPSFLFYSFLYGAVCGGLFSLVVLIRKKMLPVAIIGLNTQVGFTGLSIPYAVPIACGVIFEMIRRSVHLF